MRIPSLKASMQLSASGAGVKKARGLRGKEAPNAGMLLFDGVMGERDSCSFIIASPARAKHPAPTDRFALRHRLTSLWEAEGERVALM